jgi:PilZ domain
MGRRSEQRIAISFPVLVTGFDPRGSPFSVTVDTQDISSTGACIKGLVHLVEPGKKIEIECRDQRAWFRVQWVGNGAGPMAGKVGVRCLEPGKYIWGVQPKASEPDTYEPRAASASSQESQHAGYGEGAAGGWTGGERRQYSRRACRIDAQVAIAGNSVRLPAQVTDISLGGCYIEMLAPLPVDTMLDLTLNPGDTTMHAKGKVRSSQTGFGMGISFTGLSPEDFEKLRKFVPPTAGVPDSALVPSRLPPTPQSVANVTPPVSRTPVAPAASLNQATTADVFEAIVQVLFRKGLVTQAELAEELGLLKAMKTQFPVPVTLRKNPRR